MVKCEVTDNTENLSVIQRIKILRTIFQYVDPVTGFRSVGMGLKDAKTYVDNMRNGEGCYMNLTEIQAKELEAEGYSVRKTTDPVQEQSKIRREGTFGVFIPDDGKKINAIKALRGACSLGLKEALGIMNDMRRTEQPVEMELNLRQINDLEFYGFTIVGKTHDHFEDDLFEVSG